MRPEQQRIAIAEACGWKCCYDGRTWLHPSARLKSKDEGGGIEGYWCAVEYLPNYLNDLNAMWEAEKGLTPKQAATFRFCLACNSGKRNTEFQSVEAAMCHATANQRAEAFLKTLGLWREEKP